MSDIEENFELHWLFHLRGAVAAPPEVAIVAIDEESAWKLGLPTKPSEWPRSLHAQLIDRLARAGARLICFDLTFDTASAYPENDLEFAAAIRRAANVVLVASLRVETVARQASQGRRRAGF